MVTVDRLNDGRTQLQLGGVTLSVTVPLKVPIPAMVIVDELDEPELMSRVVGLADNRKPATETVTVVVLARVELYLPVTMTV
jgi:hypothetical protein